ncbi:MAG: hypothetical protein ACLUEQ_08180 [Cloacibacillus evryensis]
MRLLIPILRPTAMDSSIIPVMIPRPPIWISAIMITCDSSPKSVAMSTTPSPVTQTADVAIKSASTGDRGFA